MDAVERSNESQLERDDTAGEESWYAKPYVMIEDA